MEKGEKNMTIKTLEHIHRLLRGDVEEKKEEYEKLASRDGKLEYLKAAEDFYKTCRVAQAALENFEAHEWR